MKAALVFICVTFALLALVSAGDLKPRNSYDKWNQNNYLRRKKFAAASAQVNDDQSADIGKELFTKLHKKIALQYMIENIKSGLKNLIADHTVVARGGKSDKYSISQNKRRAEEAKESKGKHDKNKKYDSENVKKETEKLQLKPTKKIVANMNNKPQTDKSNDYKFNHKLRRAEEAKKLKSEHDENMIDNAKNIFSRKSNKVGSGQYSHDKVKGANGELMRRIINLFQNPNLRKNIDVYASKMASRNNSNTDKEIIQADQAQTNFHVPWLLPNKLKNPTRISTNENFYEVPKCRRDLNVAKSAQDATFHFNSPINIILNIPKVVIQENCQDTPEQLANNGELNQMYTIFNQNIKVPNVHSVGTPNNKNPHGEEDKLYKNKPSIHVQHLVNNKHTQNLNTGHRPHAHNLVNTTNHNLNQTEDCTPVSETQTTAPILENAIATMDNTQTNQPKIQDSEITWLEKLQQGNYPNVDQGINHFMASESVDDLVPSEEYLSIEEYKPQRIVYDQRETISQPEISNPEQSSLNQEDPFSYYIVKVPTPVSNNSEITSLQSSLNQQVPFDHYNLANHIQVSNNGEITPLQSSLNQQIPFNHYNLENPIQVSNNGEITPLHSSLNQKIPLSHYNMASPKQVSNNG